MADKHNIQSERDDIDIALTAKFKQNTSSHETPLWDDLFISKEIVTKMAMPSKPIPLSTPPSTNHRLLASVLVAAAVLCGLFIYTKPDQITSLPLAPKNILSAIPSLTERYNSSVLTISDLSNTKILSEIAENRHPIIEKLKSLDLIQSVDKKESDKAQQINNSESKTDYTEIEKRRGIAFRDQEIIANTYERDINRINWNRPSNNIIFTVASSLSSSRGGGTSDIAQRSIPPVNINILSYHNSINFEGGEWQHFLPVEVVLNIKYEIYNNLYVGTGVSYSYSKSTIEMVDRIDYKLTQNVNYIGVPLSLSYIFLDISKLSLYGNLSSMAEFNVHTGRTVESFIGGKVTTSESKTLDNKTPLISLQTGIGVAYNLTDKISIFSEPGVNYTFKNDNHIPTYKTESKYQFNFKVGLNFNL